MSPVSQRAGRALGLLVGPAVFVLTHVPTLLRPRLLFLALVLLATAASAGCTPPAVVWLPDSSGFVYTGGKVNRELFVYDLKTKKPRLVADTGCSTIRPAVSPDGKRVAVARVFSDEHKADKVQVIVFDLQGKVVHRSPELDWGKHGEENTIYLTALFWDEPGKKLLVYDVLSLSAGIYDLESKRIVLLEGWPLIFGTTPISPDGKKFLLVKPGERNHTESKGNLQLLDWQGKTQAIDFAEGAPDMFDPYNFCESQWVGDTALVASKGIKVRIDTAKRTAKLEAFSPKKARVGDLRIYQQYGFPEGGAKVRVVSNERMVRLEAIEPGSYKSRIITDWIGSSLMSPAPNKELLAVSDMRSEPKLPARIWVVNSNGKVVHELQVSADDAPKDLQNDKDRGKDKAKDKPPDKIKIKKPDEKQPVDPDPIHALEGHEGAVLCVAFSPDARKPRAVSGSADKTVRLWDLKTGKQIKCFKGHTGEVVGVAFSPDGRHIMSAGADKTIRVLDTEEKKEPQVLKGHTGKITSVAFAPDGNRVVSASMDKTARVWDLEKGKEVSVFKGHSLGVLCVALSSDGKVAVSGGQDKMVRLWDTATGKELAKHDSHRGWVYSVAISPDSDVIVSGGADGRLIRKKLVKVDNGTYNFAFSDTKDDRHGAIYAVAFYRDGGNVVAGCDNKQVYFYRSNVRDFLATGAAFASGSLSERKSYRGHKEPVRSVAVSPDGLQILSGSEDGTLRLYKLTD
jgi:WD40 repeat protein